MTLKSDWVDEGTQGYTEPDWTFTSTAANDVADAVNENTQKLNGVVQLDSFDGATDDDKLTAALSYAAAQTYIPAIMMPARSVTFSTTINPFDGMRIIGPLGSAGPKNYDTGTPAPVNHVVVLDVGNGTSSWINCTNNVGFGTLNVYVGGITFVEGNTSAQFLHADESIGFLYSSQFHDLQFFGFKHIFGTPAAAASLGGSMFSGNWQVQAFRDTPFNLRGSDNTFWLESWANIASDNTPPSTPSPMVWFDSMGKTTVGKMYLTVKPSWVGLEVGSGSELTFIGSILEGGSDGSPADYALARFTWAGDITMLGCSFNYLDDTNADGVIEVVPGAGFHLAMICPRYLRADACDVTFPFIYQTGGTLYIRNGLALKTAPGSELMRWRKTDTSVVTIDPTT